MTAIQTRFIGPTNYRGSRIVAETTDNRPSTGKKDRLTVPSLCHLNPMENHMRAAALLAEKIGFYGEWTSAGTDSGYLFVRVRDVDFVTVDPRELAA
jgi:hypothetical protein